MPSNLKTKIKTELKNLYTEDVLSHKEYRVLILTLDGTEDIDIASALELTEHSVVQYRANAKKKVKIATRNFEDNHLLGNIYSLT